MEESTDSPPSLMQTSTSRNLSTPENQIIRMVSQLSVDSPVMDDNIMYTPATKSNLQSSKQKASADLAENPPEHGALYVTWRIRIVRSQIAYYVEQLVAASEVPDNYTDSQGRSKADLVELVRLAVRCLHVEQMVLKKDRRRLVEDLSDLENIGNRTLTDAYIDELIELYEKEYTKMQKLPGSKARKPPDRKPFQHRVRTFLGSKITYEGGTPYYWCNVLGQWLPSRTVTAHIVPQCFRRRHMGRIFGSSESPFESKRNGLSLVPDIGKKFDSSDIAIVPVNIGKNPTEWKLVVLNPAILDKTFFSDCGGRMTGKSLWYWRDVDGRSLTFVNTNRPARRYLYFRYLMTWIYARKQDDWRGFETGVPPNKVWATPNKPRGYLKSSILRDLACRVGDKLPEDLVRLGEFEDPGTSSSTSDRIASLELIEGVREYLRTLEAMKDTSEENGTSDSDDSQESE